MKHRIYSSLEARSTMAVLVRSSVLAFTVVFLHCFAQTNIVLPGNLADQFGNLGYQLEDRALQQFYGQSLFTSAPADQLLITSVSFRHAAGASFDKTFDEIFIQMGTFDRPLSEVQRWSEANWQADRTLVYNQSNVLLRADSSTPASVFEVEFQLDRPFLYDRREGSLILYMASREGSGGISEIDFASSTAPGMVSLVPIGMFGNLLNDSGLVTRFTFVAVPEPATGFLIILGCTVIRLVRRARK